MDRSIKDELQTRFVLFSVEGTAEGVVIQTLVDNDKLAVPRNRIVKDPLTFTPFTRLRKAADIQDRFLMQNYAVDGAEGLLIARVIDSRNAKLSLARPYRSSVIVRDFITAPEIEMLIIHSEGAYNDWLKASRRDRQMRPSDFCVQELRLQNVKEESFLKSYWKDCDSLVRSIREYSSKLGKRKDHELKLVDMLR